MEYQVSESWESHVCVIAFGNVSLVVCILGVDFMTASFLSLAAGPLA